MALDHLKVKRPTTPARPAPPVRVQFGCGHSLPATALASMPCPPCRRQAADEQRRLAKQQRDQSREVLTESSRLPDGTAKTCTWADGAWWGVMTLPTGLRLVYHGPVGGSEKDCFQSLDKLYRRHLTQGNQLDTNEEGRPGS